MSSALKRTPLHGVHLESGARMVDFGGWEMPVSYGSQIEEHHAVRSHAGMFDVSHMLNTDLAGADATPFLRRLLANDVARLSQPGKALYSCMLNPEGGVVDDLIVYFFAPDRWRIVVNAATADKDIAWMRRVAAAGRFDVAITPRRDLAMVAVQGPEARGKVWAVRPAWQPATEGLAPFTAAWVDDDTLVGRTGYTGEDGFEIMLPAVAVEACLARPRRAGCPALRAGRARHPAPGSRHESVRPGHGRLDSAPGIGPVLDGIAQGSRAPVRRPRCHRGLPARPGVAGPEIEGTRRDAPPHGGAYTVGQGEITSGTMSPTIGVSIAFARLPAGSKAGDACEVDIRGKWVPAEVAKLPFVRNGKVQA